MIRKGFFWMLLIALIGYWVFADTFFPPETITAESAHIIDGDTLVINHKAYRLLGIDAPEYRQTCKDGAGKDWPCGKAARAQLVALTTSGSITCIPSAIDRFGRNIAKCSSATIPDLGEAMVQSGLAISPAEYGSAVYETAETSAKISKRRLWQGTFDTPSAWRTAHPRTDQPKL